ncbi:F-box domain, cyclin-like protein [Cynara cardunculus var. scolymus]|uniref:F-box domain, cyclin-like protein n=1 Tax=Cynara cardunculus var. scolymus TaxID=59895 RepID=A0A124SB24_CYNCS|nr:F-box domain, cyclin-like protein [Cynara cardunculus var. scolymus]
MDLSTSNAGLPPSNKRRGGFSPTTIQALNDDIIHTVFSSLDFVHIIRCTAVCKSNAINKSKLLQTLYHKQRGIFGADFEVSTSSEGIWKRQLEDLAISQHRSCLHAGSVDIYQWKGHSDGIDKCKMKMGLVLTGGSSKVMRLWSVESYRCLAEYHLPHTGSLIDFNFDESKEVTYVYGGAMRGKIYFPHKVVNFLEVLACDPEAVVGCEDGRARVFDMYGRKWSRIIKMHDGPITCLSFSDDQMLIGGSSFGRISISDLSSDQQVARLKTNDSADLSTLCYNSRSHILFTGSRAGRASSWDLSPNLLCSIQHMRDDISILAMGGLDGVLRLVDQQNGNILSGCIMDESSRKLYRSQSPHLTVTRKKGIRVSEDARIDLMPRTSRPSINCLAVGMQKVVTVHADGISC